MSYDLVLDVGADERGFADYLRRLGRFTLSPGQATYRNETTDVEFALHTEARANRVRAHAVVAYLRPPSFGLEADAELRSIVELFPETRLASGEPYSGERMLADWNAGNRAAHEILVRSDALPPNLPRWTLEHAWRWNYTREDMEDRLVDSGGCFVPRIVAVRDPARGGRAATAVVWPEQDTLLPEVDLVLLPRKDGPTRAIAWEALSPLLKPLERGSATDMIPLRHVWAKDVPRELRAKIHAAAAEARVDAIPLGTVLAHELVAAAVLLPRVRAFAAGAAADFEISSSATSAHTTTFTTVASSGVVRIEQFGGEEDPRELGPVPAAEVRKLAAIIVESGFPDFRVPPAPARSTAPPVRLALSGGGLMLSAEILASQTVPGFDDVHRALHRIVALAERGGFDLSLQVAKSRPETTDLVRAAMGVAFELGAGVPAGVEAYGRVIHPREWSEAPFDVTIAGTPGSVTFRWGARRGDDPRGGCGYDRDLTVCIECPAGRIALGPVVAHEEHNLHADAGLNDLKKLTAHADIAAGDLDRVRETLVAWLAASGLLAAAPRPELDTAVTALRSVHDHLARAREHGALAAVARALGAAGRAWQVAGAPASIAGVRAAIATAAPLVAGLPPDVAKYAAFNLQRALDALPA